MITGKDRAIPMKADDLSASAFVVGKMNGCPGDNVMNFLVRLSGLPQVVPFLKGPFDMGLGQEIAVKLPEIICKKISRRQHITTSQSILFHHYDCTTADSFFQFRAQHRCRAVTSVCCYQWEKQSRCKGGF